MDPSFLSYGKPSLFPEDLHEVQNVLTTSTLTRGEYVKAFEHSVAKFCDALYAVAFNSGSSALQAVYFALDIQAGDRIISTPNTFIATVGSAVQRGAHPVFVDLDRQTGNLQENQAAEAINIPMSRGRPVCIPVHFSGIAVDMRHLDQLIKNPNAILIEDAAHALGSFYPSGEKVGSCAYSEMTIFSFHPVKTITTGEGGLVTTNNPSLYEKLVLFRNNGIHYDPLKVEQAPWSYEVEAFTGNYHLTEFQAALGLSQMKHLDAFIEKRRELVALYRKLLGNHPHLRLFTEEADKRSAFHLFVVQIDYAALNKSRAALMKALKEQGIGTQVHYIPLYHHPVFSKRYGDLSEQFPETEGYFKEALSLPLHVALKEDDIHYICKTLTDIIN